MRIPEDVHNLKGRRISIVFNNGHNKAVYEFECLVTRGVFFYGYRLPDGSIVDDCPKEGSYKKTYAMMVVPRGHGMTPRRKPEIVLFDYVVAIKLGWEEESDD